MTLFELIVALLMGGALLTAWAERTGVPFPPLLALAGAVAAAVPGTPEITMQPGLALALFVAPVLLDAAFDTSLRDLRLNWMPVCLLVFGAVGLTVAAVAVVARWAAGWALPGEGGVGAGAMGWAAAVTLGAIVAPPDASAAISVLRRVRPPHRMTVVLEGESLLNDASALLIYRVAVGAAAAGGAVHWGLLPVMLLLTAAGGVVLGLLAAEVMMRVSPLLRAHLPTWVMVQFLACFAVWLAADVLTVSPIITMVAFAMRLARSAPGRMDGRSRIASYAVWDVAVFVLNILAFVLVGLQLKSILGRMDGALGGYLLFAGLVLGTVVLARYAALLVGNPVLLLLPHEADRRPTLRGSVAVGWCGMRGIVTLATALALPEGFPQRDLLVFTAFAVTLGTLVLHGFTLGPLLRWLRLEDDGSVGREVLVGRRGALEAVHRHLQDAGTPAAAALAQKYAGRLSNSDEAGDHAADEVVALRRAAIAAGRAELSVLRARGLIGDDAFHLVEEEMDLDDLSTDPRLRWGQVGGARG